MERTPTLRLWRFAIAAAVVLGASFGMAADDPDALFPNCGREPTPSDVEAAKLAHRAAAQLFERGEYDRAIENWRDTYKLDCTAHAVLINVASAYDKKGDKESAIAALEAYLKRLPNAPDAASITQRIESLKSALPSTSSLPKPEPTATATPTVAASARPPAVPKPLPKPERPYGVKPWFVVGVGGVGLISGAILIPLGLGAIADAETACGGGRACLKGQSGVADDGNSGRVQVIAGDIALGVGAAAAVGGLVWQFVFNKPRLLRAPETQEEPAPSVSVAPSVGGTSGVTVVGTF